MPESPAVPSALPGWLPSSGIRPVRTGAFDAVAVPRGIGIVAIELLGDRCGAVIANASDATLFWLVAPGTTQTWTLRHVYRYQAGSRLLIPAIDVPPSWWLHWRVPPRGHGLTDTGTLHKALTQAIAHQYGFEQGAGR